MPKPATRRRARPRLSQHFLRDAQVRDRILAAVPDDALPIIEVGAGDGVLTFPLARLGRPLVAVERDEGLAAHTRWHLPPRPDCRVITADVLAISTAELLAEVGAAAPYGVVGNLPYAITAPILRKFLSREAVRPQWLLVMMQREVAEQVVAPAGRRSLLSVSVQFYAEPEILFAVEREAFDPPPAVRSAVVRIRARPTTVLAGPSEAQFFRVVRAGFSAPRKQLHNALGGALALPPAPVRRWLAANAIDHARRAATLTLEEWAQLARSLPDAGGGEAG